MNKMLAMFVNKDFAQLKDLPNKTVTPVISPNPKVIMDFENNNLEIYSYIVNTKKEIKTSYYHDHCYCEDLSITEDIPYSAHEVKIFGSKAY